MIKHILTITLLLLSLSTFSNAKYLMYIEFNDKNDDTVVRCIDRYYFDDRGLIYTKSADGNDYLFRFDDMRRFDITAGYYLNEDDYCVVANKNTSDYVASSELSMSYDNFTFLGIPLEYFNSLMALSGLFISAMFLYGLTRFI
ncbi:MAG: hypothetical protein U9Q20_08215 [Campylobacterota bacterium]|nr:hypothetical protein [Campylobacterota bacterium]